MPKRYAGIDDRESVLICLHADSETVAKSRAVWDEMIEGWEAKLAGRSDDAAVPLAAAKELAARRGFQYMPIREVAHLPANDLLARIEALLTSKGKIDKQVMEAVLGVIPPPPLKASGALVEFWRVANERTLGKSDDQIRRWRNPRIKAFGDFIAAAGDKTITEITTNDLTHFKAALFARVKAGKISTQSANKELIHFVGSVRV